MRLLVWLGGAIVMAVLGLATPVLGASVQHAGSQSTPTITLSVSSGSVGTPLTIAGNGFPALEIVALYIDAPSPFIGTPGPRADSQGAFVEKITWPGRDYDTSGSVDPFTPGPHSICGDTTYPGSSPPVAAKACAQFEVVGDPSPSPTPPSSRPSSNNPGGTSGGASLPEVLVVVAILVALAAGTVLWMRRTR